MKLLFQIVFLFFTWFANLSATPVFAKVVLPSDSTSFATAALVNDCGVKCAGISGAVAGMTDDLYNQIKSGKKLNELDFKQATITAIKQGLIGAATQGIINFSITKFKAKYGQKKVEDALDDFVQHPEKYLDDGVQGAGNITALLAKWDDLTASEIKSLFNGLSKSEIKSITQKQWGAVTANKNFKLEYITENVDFENYIPPYKVGTFAQEITLSEDVIFVRLHYGKNEVGRWMMTVEDYKLLLKDPAKFKDLYALPSMPTKASLVKIPKGTTIWKGQAADNKWGIGGGTQIQVDDFIKYKTESTYWFKLLANF